MKLSSKWVRVALGIGLFLIFAAVWGNRRGFMSAWTGQPGGRPVVGSGLDPNDPVLKASLPVPDPAAGLEPSPLNTLLKPDLSPEEQTEIVGQLLIDYWTNLHTLPAGTWEETCAALSGRNAKNISFVPKNHPALGKDAFRSKPDSPGIRLHVISSSSGVFQLTFDGPDGQPFTKDDLIRNFPPDLTF